MANDMADGMDKPSALQPSALQFSALAQAGVTQTRFESASISLREVTGATLIRVHTLAHEARLRSRHGFRLPSSPIARQ
jgi:hypothetical protein